MLRIHLLRLINKIRIINNNIEVTVHILISMKILIHIRNLVSQHDPFRVMLNDLHRKFHRLTIIVRCQHNQQIVQLMNYESISPHHLPINNRKKSRFKSMKIHHKNNVIQSKSFSTHSIKQNIFQIFSTV